jgi:hypothetical protein
MSMKGKPMSKTNHNEEPELKKNCIPQDEKTRKEMIELFIIENLHDPEKFEYGPMTLFTFQTTWKRRACT